jgi:hypothetical protein
MIKTLLANKHTSTAAIAYIFASVVAELGAVWFPEYKAQFVSTMSVLEKVALTYGLIMAGDAKPTVTTDTPKTP